MNIPPDFRHQYDLCLTNQALFDGYDVSPEEYQGLSNNTNTILRSSRTMRVGTFVFAHMSAMEDLDDLPLPIPEQSASYHIFTQQSLADLRRTQLEYQYSWSKFFSVYLHAEFQKFEQEDSSWSDATHLSWREIIQAKRTKLESVKSCDRVAQARKRTAYLTIAALAHRNEPLAS